MPNASAHEAPDAVRGFEVAVDVNGLEEVEHAIRALLESVNNVVGILGSKAREDDAAMVRFAVARGVFEEDDLGGVGDVSTAIGGKDCSGDVKVVGKDSGLVGFAIVVGVLEDEDAVVFFGPRDDVGIHSAGDEPEAALRVEVHLHWLCDHGIGSEELDLHPFGEVEGGFLLYRIRIRDVFEPALGENDARRERGSE